MAHDNFSMHADRYQALWEQGGPPNVYTFLEENAVDSAKEKLAILLIDQAHRWHSDDPISVEEYLNQLPDVASDKEAVLDLVVGEYQAREASGKAISVDELISRFSDLEDSLRSKLESVNAVSTNFSTDPANKTDEYLELSQTQSEKTESFDSDTTGIETVGRYRLLRVLGEGGFARVWLAQDEELKRQVAIKIPMPKCFEKKEDADAYLAEAQTIASLDHPHIVPVYDVGKADNDSVYIVSKFIEGNDLAWQIKENRPGFVEAAKLIATIAQALHHAHERRLVHRDVKPANILIEAETQHPYVTDFGLAIREEDYLQEGRIAGTPLYMSPEQARGEGHRLNGRSDLFSLGIVLYELLTGKRPFKGNTSLEVLHQVINVEPTRLKGHNDEIPNELERICLKALSKRASDRYTSGLEFSDDLMHWVIGPEDVSVKEVEIIPKGLRAFDADDADFFLDLLPGPRDRNGLPESIRFWKNRIEEHDSDKTFTVGLMYGPSGCGKSSLVKAGLIPRLSDEVIPLYVEATPDGTEACLLRAIRKSIPDLSEDLGLVESCIALRRDSRKKLVIILDQFEQWLHAKSNETETDLIRALRQCDGGNLQAVCMVRDDFWLSSSRFMRALDLRIIVGQNSALVDLFDQDHARHVLVKYGQAFHKISTQLSSITEDQKTFLDRVVSGLAQDGKVVSVRISLFAEMVKGKPWATATLNELGGIEGVGVTFLEETFSARTAPPEHRLHQQAARNTLRSLLPEGGTVIKGHMRSREELLEVSGYSVRGGKDFDDLLHILNGELRLITPTDSESTDAESENHSGSKYYQLTHDYLVPSLREWLTRKQKETRKGRAELRLEERAGLWSNKPEKRHLPSWWEWASIRCLTQEKKWTDPQRAMMKRAGRVHGTRFSLLLAFVMTMTIGGWYITNRVAEESNQERATGLVSALVNADIYQVPGMVADLREYHRWTDPKLQQEFQKAPENSNARINVSLALLPGDSKQVEYLKKRLLDARPDQVDVIREALSPYKDQFSEELWEILKKTNKSDANRVLRAASALSLYYPASERWKTNYVTAFDAFNALNPVYINDWIPLLTPAIFEPELDRKLQHSWNDKPPVQSWVAPQREIVQRIEKAHGLVAERFAFCQTMPLDDFNKIAEEFRKSGYRPARFRPYSHNGTVHVAAVWKRDGRDWRVLSNLNENSIQEQDETQRSEGFVATDLAGYIGGSSDAPKELYVGVWIKKQDDTEDARVLVGTSYTRFKKDYRSLVMSGYKVQRSLQEFRGLDDQQKYCSVMINGGITVTGTHGASLFAVNQTPATFEDKDSLSLIHWDLDLSNASKKDFTKTRNEKAILDAKTILKVKPGNLKNHKSLGMAHFHLGQDKQAIDEFNFLIRKRKDSPTGYQYRAVLNARMGNAEAARKDLAKFKELSKSPDDIVYFEAWVSAYLDENTEGLKRLEAYLDDRKELFESLYNVARIYAIASGTVKEKDAARSKAYADRAVDLIKQSVEKGYYDYLYMQQDSALEPIHQRDGFIKIIQAGKSTRRMASVWNTSKQFESLESHGLTAEEHLVKCREMQTNGYRVVSLSTASINGELVTASVWHRPLIPDVEIETLARRQANAAVALVQMGKPERVWPLLKHRPDPRLSTWIIHRLSPMGVSPGTIAQQLTQEKEVSIRRALILALGECIDISTAEKTKFTSMLLDWYQVDPDPGVRGASEWVLRKWGKQPDMDGVDDALATGKLKENRQWYVTKTNKHSMSLIQDPSEFLMGSPEAEEGHLSSETLHRILIPRSYFISNKEVTVAQFHQFAQETGIKFVHDEREGILFPTKISPEETCPRTFVSWYQAAMYCRWLSEQEGIPEDQMCFPPLKEIKEGMKVPENYLQRTGYRLPSEAEWEFACRGRTQTSRYYGETPDLLDKYAWSFGNSKSRTWPVGTFKPNSFGLFDVLGNAAEWCQEISRYYKPGLNSKLFEDHEQPILIAGKQSRGLRGGSFLNIPVNTRSAHRGAFLPAGRGFNASVRLARTYNGSP